MAIEWEEEDIEPGGNAVRLFTGHGSSGETYTVWYGGAFAEYMNPDTRVMRWIAMGWPEVDTDRLPLFESKTDAFALCETWDAIKIDAERRGRAAFTGTRAGL